MIASQGLLYLGSLSQSVTKICFKTPVQIMTGVVKRIIRIVARMVTIVTRVDKIVTRIVTERSG